MTFDPNSILAEVNAFLSILDVTTTIDPDASDYDEEWVWIDISFGHHPLYAIASGVNVSGHKTANCYKYDHSAGSYWEPPTSEPEPLFEGVEHELTDGLRKLIGVIVDDHFAVQFENLYS